MQIDLDALERYSRLIVDGPHDHLPQSFVKAHENTLALIAKVRELERLSAVAYQNGMADERKASDQYAKGWNDARRATDGQRDTARGVPEGYRLVPAEPTEEMLDAGWQHTGDPCWKHNVADAYRAMLAAAPTPPDGDAERDRRDAARYRWLRDEHIGDDPDMINLALGERRGLDAAIDAAVAASKDTK